MLVVHCVPHQYVFSANPDIFWTAPRTHANSAPPTCLDAHSVSAKSIVSAAREASMLTETHANDVTPSQVVCNVPVPLNAFSVIMDTT